MGFALALVAASLGLLALLLAVPVDLAFRVNRVAAVSGEFDVRWLFGLVHFRIVVPEPEERRRRKRKPGPRLAGAPTARGGRRAGARVFAALRQAAFRRRALRFAADLVRSAGLRQVRARLRVGLGDPADTGRLWAIVGPLGAAAGSVRGAEIRIEPEFIHAVLELDIRARMRLVPMRVIATIIAFALSPPSMRAWFTPRGDHA